VSDPGWRRIPASPPCERVSREIRRCRAAVGAQDAKVARGAGDQATWEVIWRMWFRAPTGDEVQSLRGERLPLG
jgi:hypothetical protein